MTLMKTNSSDIITCASCNVEVDTPAEITSYPSGECPNCGTSWTGKEVRTTRISVFAPAASGET